MLSKFRLAGAVAVLACCATMLAVPGNTLAASSSAIRITSLSNPMPELVSGGQDLVRINVPVSVTPASVRVLLNSTDVTSDFELQPDGTLLGSVTGLPEGSSILKAWATGPSGNFLNRPKPGTLVVTNHSINGPVFAGPQPHPFYCQTEAFGLAPATQPTCSAPTQIRYVYRSTSSEGSFDPIAKKPFKTLANPEERPEDLAYTTVNGNSVPFIVRLEQGTIDRGVFQIAALYDGSEPSPLHPDTSWNQRLLYTFGGGCNTPRAQGAATGGVFNELALSQGFAVTSNTLNVLQNNCSVPISAEAAMMTKAHFIDTYGPVLHTIGMGGSGGAIQSYDIADAYPGIVNGIIPSLALPDASGAVGQNLLDCEVLRHFFATHPGMFTPAEQTAVMGFNSSNVCLAWEVGFGAISTPTASCSPLVPSAELWNEETNPTGVKCDALEEVVNQVGVNPTTGFARNFQDNAGVQYGLGALESGAITPAQFAALNKGVGGHDYQARWVPQRMEGDAQALKAVYSDGLALNGGLGLSTTPVIDHRDYNEKTGLEVHSAVWSFVIRQRMQEAHVAGNDVIIESTDSSSSQQAAARAYELASMDQWLTSIESDTSKSSLKAKVAADRPAGLVDACFLGSSSTETPTPQPGGLTRTGTEGPCPAAYPIYATGRLVAGQALNLRTLKCTLKPLKLKSYPVTFTAEEQTELQSAFPDGVCNYRKRGPEQPAGKGRVWLDYSNAPSGEPFSNWPSWPHALK